MDRKSRHEVSFDVKRTLLILPVLSLVLSISPALSHPGSGIVADGKRNIYFVDTGSGVWKVDVDNKLTRVSGPAYHWMAIDSKGRFKNVRLPSFASGQVTISDVGAPLILSSDFPVAVGIDGNLYYPRADRGQQLQIFEFRPSGTTAVFATLPARTESGPLRWLNGMAEGPDGAVYLTENNAVRKITRGGELSTILDGTQTGCESPGRFASEPGPYFRGLDVDADGTVYVAATGCGSVLKVSREGKATVILHASSPWSPTGVVVSGRNIYVLEYLHTEGDDRREWIPRVKKISPDGKVVTVATVERQ